MSIVSQEIPLTQCKDNEVFVKCIKRADVQSGENNSMHQDGDIVANKQGKRAGYQACRYAERWNKL